MDLNTATEQAYKNGYEQGKKDAAKEIFNEMKNLSIADNGFFVALNRYDFDRFFKNHFGVKIDDGE